MSLYLIPVVREQRDRIAALEARLAALEQAAKPTFFMNCRVDPAFPHLTTCY